MKKIWICGGSGMLGSHFNRYLKEKEIPFVSTNSKEIDITDLGTVSDYVRTQKITHIINCAAYTNVDKAETEQKQAYLINAIGPYNLGVAGRRHGSRVIHFSTDYVFDGLGKSPYTEEHICTPISAYGMSKLAGELKLLDEHRHACVIRTSWLFGYPGKNFIDSILKLMSERDSISVVGDQIGRPTYCQDLVEATLPLIDETGIFHFSNAFETNRHRFAKEIYRQACDLGYPLKECQIECISSLAYPLPAKRPLYSVLSTKKIEKILGYPPRSWQVCLQDYLQANKEHYLSKLLVIACT